MAGKQENIFDGFGLGIAAQKRKEQQEQIETAITGKPSSEKGKKRGGNATTITLAISGEDKAMFKVWAAKQGATMSDVLHDWIVQECAGV